jgi:hypothetical protein
VPFDVWTILFSEWSLQELARHRITDREVRDLVDGRAWVVRINPRYPDQRRITGVTSAGRWLTIVLAPEQYDPKTWHAVTGRPASQSDVNYYQRKTR